MDPEIKVFAWLIFGVGALMMSPLILMVLGTVINGC